MSKERVKQYRLRQKELGRLKREMYLTDSEFNELKIKLDDIRSIKMACDKCGYLFNESLGRYGCPNCNGEGLN